MVRNIIFDLGGVLFDIDYAKTFEELSVLSGTDLTADHPPVWFQTLSDNFERGVISEEAFIWMIQDKFPEKCVTANEIVQAWNSMLLGWNKEKLKFLDEACLNYNLYLLSNTNTLHLRWFRYDLKKVHGICDFDHRYFKATYYSHEIGMRKPESAIFNHVLKTNQLDIADTVYIDDSAQHIEAAANLGIRSLLFERNADLNKHLFEKLIQS